MKLDKDSSHRDRSVFDHLSNVMAKGRGRHNDLRQEARDPLTRGEDMRSRVNLEASLPEHLMTKDELLFGDRDCDGARRNEDLMRNHGSGLSDAGRVVGLVGCFATGSGATH